MKHSTTQATFCAYAGAILLVLSFYPALDVRMNAVPMLHTLWHLWLLVATAMLIYGIETLRTLARRYRRMTT